MTYEKKKTVFQLRNEKSSSIQNYYLIYHAQTKIRQNKKKKK